MKRKVCCSVMNYVTTLCLGSLENRICAYLGGNGVCRVCMDAGSDKIAVEGNILARKER